MVRVSPSATAFCRLSHPRIRTKAARPSWPACRDDKAIEYRRAVIPATCDPVLTSPTRLSPRLCRPRLLVDVVLSGSVNAKLTRGPVPSDPQSIGGDYGDNLPNQTKRL